MGNPRANRRIDSWKEIATFFRRDERTVKRWEKNKFLPVHRIPGSERGGVFAYTEELTEWLNTPLPAKRSSQRQTVRPGVEAVAGSHAKTVLYVAPRARLFAEGNNGSGAFRISTGEVTPDVVPAIGKSCSIYTKQRSGQKVKYSFVQHARLFGWSSTWNRGGWLPRLLQEHLAASPAEITGGWHVNRAEISRSLGTNPNNSRSNALVVEMRPDKASLLLARLLSFGVTRVRVVLR